MPAWMNTRNTPGLTQTAGKEDKTAWTFLTPEVSELLMHKWTCLATEFLPIGEQEVKALKVMCSNSENGCSWMGEPWSLDNHLITCLLHCPNKHMKNKKDRSIMLFYVAT